MPCGICGSNNIRLALEVERQGNSWDIYECLQCLTQFILPIPPIRELEELYHRYYGDEGERVKQLRTPNYGRLSFPRQWGIIRGLAKKKRGRILDFGCGGGHFLDRVSSKWEKYGVELSENARTVARAKGIVVVEFADTLKTAGKFDVVTMFATIEHLPNPREVVSQLSGLLKVGGLFVVMTGDVGSIKAKHQGKRWYLYTPPGHLYFFATHSLDYLMESFGFKKIKHLYTDGGVTRIPFMPLNLALRLGLETYFRLPVLNRLPLFDTYYGYYKKE